jgi:hypothetical protein
LDSALSEQQMCQASRETGSGDFLLSGDSGACCIAAAGIEIEAFNQREACNQRNATIRDPWMAPVQHGSMTA